MLNLLFVKYLIMENLSLKHCFGLQKQKKQKVIDIKELKFRPNIDLNDFNIKIKSIKKFLAAGDKVKIS